MKPAPLLLALWLLSSIAIVLHGEPFPEEASVSLQLPERAALGDRIAGKFIIQNKGTRQLTVGLGDELHVEVVDDKGHSLTPIQPLGAAGYVALSTVLQPGETADKAFYLDDYVHFLGPSNYIVSVGSGWGLQPDEPVLIAKAKIEIHSPTPKYAATRAHALCAKQTSLKKADEVGIALLHLRDPAYLAPLRKEAEAGHPDACLGIASLDGAQASEVLLQLTESPNPKVAKAAAMALVSRLPRPQNEQWDQPGWFPSEIPEVIRQTWPEKLDPPLLKLAVKILQAAQTNYAASPPKAPDLDPSDYFRLSSTDPVSIAAEMIIARGTSAQVPALMAATDRALGIPFEPRTGVLGAFDQLPGPLPALIAAIDALRHRGWVIKTRDGGATPELGRSGGLLAFLRQLADPKAPKPQTDEQARELALAFTDGSLVIRENAWRALPQPFLNDWERPLLSALEDPDFGVVIAACQAAGDSGHKDFLLPLAQLVESIHATSDLDPACGLVREAATTAAVKLGGGAVLWEAWANVLPEETGLVDALRHLCIGTIDFSPDVASSSSGGLSRSQRFLLRDAWREFIQKHRELLDHGGRVPRDDPSITPILTARSSDPFPIISIRFADGTEWPKANTAKTPPSASVPGVPGL